MKSFNVPQHYRSPIISAIKNKRRNDDKLKKDFTPELLKIGTLEIVLARHFGFCYGVENAIEIAFKAIEENPDKRIFLLSEMIHNPGVNADLQALGVRFIMDTKGNALINFNEITRDDIVVIPAFGTTLETEEILSNKGIDIRRYETTCPFVERVWNRANKIGNEGYSIVIHGKPGHEETRATFSHARQFTPTVIVKDMKHAILLGKYITNEFPPEQFYADFKGQHSSGFDVTKDLQYIGVVNQTTMLSSETQAIADYLKQVVNSYFPENNDLNAKSHFADTRDTLCYATNDNQNSVLKMLDSGEADIAIVIGGYNSSNTSHLVELCEHRLPTYFIKDEQSLVSFTEIQHYNIHQSLKCKTENYLPTKNPIRIMVTSGASCPDTLVENVIKRLAFLTGNENEYNQLLEAWEVTALNE